MITVAIVEDIKEIREGLQALINLNAEFTCPAVFASAEEALSGVPAMKPDVVLLDINLPGMNGIDYLRQVKPLLPHTQFVMSTVYEDDDSIFESLKAGATGYLLKKTAPSRILEAIAEVNRGESPMSPQIARRVISSFQRPNESFASALLSPRENEILKGLAKGLRYKEIAGQYAISLQTVRTHVRHIYEKLHVQSRTEALNKIYGTH